MRIELTTSGLPKHTEADEQRISELSDGELPGEWHRAEVESSLADLIAGEMERLNLDD